MMSELNIRCIFCIIRRFFGVLLSVAYFVLVERKFLAYVQNRKGPNKVGLVGIFGDVRGMAQVISYEVVMVITVLIPRFRLGTYDYYFLYEWKAFSLGLLWLPIFYVWVLGVLAETHWAPFDFVEGESELMSGYNVEYSGGLFVLLFLGEYCGIMYIRMVTVLLWWKYLFRFTLFFLSRAVIVLFLILVRGSFPRLRYDLLMILIWKSLLPISLRFLIFFLFSYCFLQKLVFFEIDSVRAANLLQQLAVVRAAEPEDIIVCELDDS